MVAPGEEVDPPACKAAAADPEGAFTVAAAEASLVEEVPVATLQRKCSWRHQERKLTRQTGRLQPQTQRALLQCAADEASLLAGAEVPGPEEAFPQQPSLPEEQRWA